MPANKPLVMGIRPYTPDMPCYGSGGTVTVRNVLPRTNLSYGPFSGLSRYTTTALPFRCQGAYAAADPSGNVSVFAGNGIDLYQIASGTTTFNNVSKVAGGYTLAEDQFWRFASLKARLIATNISDPIQTFTLGSSLQFADLSADAPKAKYCAGIKQWLMVANTSDPVGGVAPWRIWWSAIGDPTSWPIPGSDSAAAVQSDYTDLAGENGAITGLVGNLGTSDGAVFFEHSVWRIVYAGPPAVFDFFPAQGVKGTQAPASIVQLGAFVYYLGEDGFYVFDGTNSTPIGANKVDKAFFADLDAAYIHRVTGAVDPLNKMVFWAYPGAGNSQGNPNRIIIFNWVTQQWGIAYIETEYLFRSLGLGYSLDGLDAVSTALDTLPFSLDSSVWVGGAIQIGAFDTAHYMSFFNGSSLEATVDMEEISPFLGQRMFVRNTRPLVDGGTPTVSIGVRERLEDTVMFNSAVAMNSIGTCPQRTSGRYGRARLVMPAGSRYSHIIGVEVDADPVGAR